MNVSFPNDWQALPFESAVADITAGNPKLQKNEYSEVGQLPIIDQGQEFIGGYSNDTNFQANINLPAIIFGDHTRIFKFIDVPFCLGADGTKILEPKVNLDKKFLYHYLKSLKIASAGYSRHYKFLKENIVPIPPLEEQKRITAILDKADNIRRKRQDAIKLADEFLRAVFLDMFGDPIKNSKSWPTQLLDQVAPSSPSRGVAASKNDHVWLLNLDNIESNTGRILAEYKCSYGEVGSSTHWFDQSHVLYSKLRPYLNKVVLPHTSGIATSELLPLKPNPELISREYLAFLLRSNPFLHWANNKVAGAKMPRLSTSELRNLLIPIPPIDLQSRFKNIVSQMSALQTKFESSSIESESLFNALSQKAFSGKL